MIARARFRDFGQVTSNVRRDTAKAHGQFNASISLDRQELEYLALNSLQLNSDTHKKEFVYPKV